MSALYLLIALTTIGISGVCFYLAQKIDIDDVVVENMPSQKRAAQKHVHSMVTMERLQQLGFSRSPLKNIALLGLILTISLFFAQPLGWMGLILSLMTGLFMTFAIAQWRRSNIKLRVIQQLPSFVDQVNRRIKVGLSVNQAIEQSSKTTTAPLKTILARVAHRRALGIELQDAFHKESVITGVSAFRLLGSIFNINTRYGGSINESLDSLVKLLRQQDLSRRELKSITGETRITAWVIGSAPIIVSAYMMMQNPELLLNMWDSPEGKNALVLSITMQCLGVILIWRMFRTL